METAIFKLALAKRRQSRQSLALEKASTKNLKA